MAADPKAVRVNLTTGTGVEIDWKDGHTSSYKFAYLRDACPCALCTDERNKDNREPGDPVKPIAGSLPLFKPMAKPTEAEAVGRYAIRFTWNDGHQHGIYSWDYFRDICPCPECKGKREAARAMERPTTGRPN